MATDLDEAEQEQRNKDEKYEYDQDVADFVQAVGKLTTELQGYRTRRWGNPFANF
jgi:hypothetical protein